MPVLRKRETVQAQSGQSGVIRPRGNQAAMQLGWQASDMMAQEAAKFGRLMGQETEEKAVGLARNAVFSMDENGVPQMPDNPTGDWGRIGRRAYKDNVERRYADRLAVSVKAQVEAAKTENPYDLDAFMANVNDRLDGMQGSVPENFGGLFNDIVADMKTTAGAAIGRAQGQLHDANQTGVQQGFNDSVISQIGQLIQAGDEDSLLAAEAVISDQFRHIANQPDHILSPAQKIAMTQELVVSSGAQRMIAGEDVRGMTPGQLATLIADVNTMNPDLMEYFTMPDGTMATEGMMRQVAGRLNTFYAQANAAEGARGTINDMTAIMEGRATETEKTRTAQDLLIADRAGIVGEDGTRAAVTWDTWLNMTPEQMARSIETVKTAGFLPASLKQLDLMIQRGSLDTETSLQGAYDLFRALKAAPNLAGEVRDMTGDFSDHTKQIFGLASALVNDGSAGDTPLEEASRRVRTMNEQEWTDVDTAFMMNEYNDGFFSNGEQVTAENARSYMNRRVVSRLSEGGYAFDGVDPSPQEIKEAQMLYETFMRTAGVDEDGVLDMVTQSMEGRWTDTEAMLGVERSAYAPEVRYAAPAAKSGLETFSNIGRMIGGGAVEGAEAFREAYTSILSLGFDDRETDWGSDLMQAEPWEILADGQIRDALQGASNAEDIWAAMGYRQGEGTRGSPLRAGEHYKLVPDGSGSVNAPVYRVFMMDKQRGQMVELEGNFRLDLRDGMAEIENNFSAFAENGAKLREEVIRRQQNGETISIDMFNDLAEQYMGVRGETPSARDMALEATGRN